MNKKGNPTSLLEVESKLFCVVFLKPFMDFFYLEKVILYTALS